MKRTLIAFLFTAALATAAPRWTNWVAPAAVCAAEATDTGYSFFAAAQMAHPYETSSALRGADGRPSPWRFALIKGGMCAASVWMAHGKGTRRLIGIGLAGPMMIQPIMGIHGTAVNLGAMREAARLQPGTAK